MTVQELIDKLQLIENKKLQIRTQLYEIISREWLEKEPDEVLNVMDEYFNNYVLIV